MASTKVAKTLKHKTDDDYTSSFSTEMHAEREALLAFSSSQDTVRTQEDRDFRTTFKRHITAALSTDTSISPTATTRSHTAASSSVKKAAQDHPYFQTSKALLKHSESLNKMYEQLSCMVEEVKPEFDIEDVVTRDTEHLRYVLELGHRVTERLVERHMRKVEDGKSERREGAGLNLEEKDLEAVVQMLKMKIPLDPDEGIIPLEETVKYAQRGMKRCMKGLPDEMV